MLKQLFIPDHYEADISFELKKGRMLVKKQYRLQHDCVKWLNQYLVKYYPVKDFLPIAQHEFAALKKLSTANLNLAPLPFDIGFDFIVMEYGGNALSSSFWKISKKNFKKHAELLLNKLKEINFCHNDILPGNVLLCKGDLKLIDFTLSEFDGILIKEHIPDLSWGRFGKDSQLINLMDFSYKAGYLNYVVKTLVRRVKHKII